MRPGKTPQVCRERSTAETLISESRAQTDHVYCHKYPICDTLSLNSTKPARCVLYKFDFSFKMKAQLSSRRSQSCGLYTASTFVRLWPKNGAEVNRHVDSFGQNKAAVWEKGEFTSSQALIKTIMKVFNQSSKVYQSRTEKRKKMQKKNKQKKKTIMSLPESELFFPRATTPFCFVICTKHS